MLQLQLSGLSELLVAIRVDYFIEKRDEKSRLFISFGRTNVNLYVMSKTRKTLVITFLALGSVLIFYSFYAKLQHWPNKGCCFFAFGGLALAVTALVITVRAYRTK